MERERNKKKGENDVRALLTLKERQKSTSPLAASFGDKQRGEEEHDAKLVQVNIHTKFQDEQPLATEFKEMDIKKASATQLQIGWT